MARIFSLIYKCLLTAIISFSVFGCKEESNHYSFKIESIRDSIYGENKMIIVSSTLTNNSEDTLKFINMSCEWQIIYSTNNPMFEIIWEDYCDGNYHQIIRVPPKDSYHKDLLLKINPANKQEFKLGINLIKIDNLRYFTGEEIFVKPYNGLENEIIWSNSIKPD